MAFEIEFTPEALGDLKALKKNDQGYIVDAIETQLLHQPAEQTRNRKRLRPNEVAAWELRIGRFRVLYSVESESNIVSIEAVGLKIGNLLFVRGREIKL